MKTQAEQLLITRFVIKDKQERYLSFLSKEKTRKKFTDELYHFKDFNWTLFREIQGNETVAITKTLNSKKNISTCSVISTNPKFDGSVISVEEAIKELVGEEGTILIFGDAEIIYYEGEAPMSRYISI